MHLTLFIFFCGTFVTNYIVRYIQQRGFDMKKLRTLLLGGLSIGLLSAAICLLTKNNNSFIKARAEAVAGVYQKVTSPSDIKAGDRVIFVNVAETHAIGDLSSGNNATCRRVGVSVSNSKITLSSDTGVTQFIVEDSISSGGFAFKAQNNTNFAGYYMAYKYDYTTGNEFMNKSDVNNEYTGFTLAYSSDHMVIRSMYNTGRYLRCSGSKFAFYYNAEGESTAQSGVNIWKASDSSSYDAEAFAQDLVDETNDQCLLFGTSSYNYEESKAAFASLWTTLGGEDYYGKLDSDQIALLVEADPHESSSNIIEVAMYRYDLITAKYGLEGFIASRVPQLGKIGLLNESFAESSNMIIIVTIATSVTLLGTLILILKRKHK